MRRGSKKAIVFGFIFAVVLAVTMGQCYARGEAVGKVEQYVPVADAGGYVLTLTTGVREDLSYTIVFNVVKWDPLLAGAPFSRNIGPTIRKGMADGTIQRASAPITFKVEWRRGASRLAGKEVYINGRPKIVPATFTDKGTIDVSVQCGRGTISMDPALIGPETELFVWHDEISFDSPPGRLPLVTDPGELLAPVGKGMKEVYLHFIMPR